MNVLHLITRLKTLDISIELVEEQLKLNAPEGALTPEILNELKNKKIEIIEFLQENFQKRLEYVSIEPSEKKEYHVLSPAQKRLFILQQMETVHISYNQPEILSLEGDIDLEKLEETFKKLVSRHESLRTSFEMIAGEPVQRIHEYEEVEFALEFHESDEDIIRDFVRPFDLSQAPLFRLRLIKKQNQTHILMMDMHHIISDGTSMKIFVNDFMALYAGKQLPHLKIQYKDCTQWQNKDLLKEAILKQEKYWLKEFEGEIPVLNLPTDYSRPAIRTFEGNTLRFQVDKKETKSLNEMTRWEGASLFMVLLAVSNIFLSKLSSQEDIVVGTPTAGRRHTDMQSILGMFVNTLALRNHPTGEQSFNGFLREVKENTLQAFENQEYQFEELVEHAAVERDISRNPLFDVMFILQNIFDPSENVEEIGNRGLDDKTLYLYKQNSKI